MHNGGVCLVNASSCFWSFEFIFLAFRVHIFGEGLGELENNGFYCTTLMRASAVPSSREFKMNVR
ncbi:hypothetical protein M513_13057 [Trichuris suis]|uniref:Uncharacterized protein n=1 Tax=Trichuris suis TaxID=68888 RepID=A0A085LM75_9BILA|nr:hypothetical protein M513_13057 [Trichuris suis]